MVEGWSTSKGHDSTSLELKATAKCEDPRPMEKAMKSYLGVEALHIKDYALEGTKLFGSTKWKLDLPPGAKCDSHWPDKVTTSFFAQTLGRKEKNMHRGVIELCRVWCSTYHISVEDWRP